MNLKNYICIIGLLACLISCSRENKQLVKDMTLLKSRPINLCLDKLELYEKGIRINDYNINNKKYTQIVFFDSVTCSPCMWKHMYQWNPIIDTTNLSFVFIFHVKKENKEKFIKAMQNDTIFSYPIYLDSIGVFLQKNPTIPHNKLLHSFLLNRNNQVVLIGNILQNPHLRDMFNKIVSTMDSNL